MAVTAIPKASNHDRESRDPGGGEVAREQPDARQPDPARLTNQAWTRVLLIEPDPQSASSLSRCLTADGYSVCVVHDAIAGQIQVSAREPLDLVILSRATGANWLGVLGAIHRAKPHLPVIVLANRAAPGDCVACLDGGAVDYLREPFSHDELAARVRTHLRVSRQADPVRLRAGDVELDRLSHRVTRAGAPVVLSAREFELLEYLMHHPGVVLSRSQLNRAVWGYDFDPGTNIVEVYVGYLRRKLGPPALIRTVRGEGYRLVTGERPGLPGSSSFGGESRRCGPPARC